MERPVGFLLRIIAFDMFHCFFHKVLATWAIFYWDPRVPTIYYLRGLDHQLADKMPFVYAISKLWRQE